MVLESFNADYVERLIAGEPETERHFTAYFGELIGLKLRSRIRSPQLIEDIRQETFLRVLKSLRRDGGIRNPERLGAFVNSVCNNVTLEMLRSSSRHGQMPEHAEETADHSASAEDELVSEDRKKLVQRVLAELPDKDQQLLRMVFIEERDKAEICKEMRVSNEYLRVLLHRAKGRFREVMLSRNAAGR